ncbi:venom protease-like [Onthophagus taurus]|uniref:venom protease-like n=1 Tax=Onthophagus taurus TaxID=166361 RepID=UPI000C1FDF33|nr:venom protease-like [Onthophagus taurus]
MNQLLTFFAVLFFALLDFTEPQHHHHHHRGHSSRINQQCPLPSGDIGVCLPFHLCPEVPFNIYRKRCGGFCGPRHKFENNLVCCPKSDNKTEIETEIRNESEINEDLDKIIFEKCEEYKKIAVEVENQVETATPRLIQTFLIGGTPSLNKEFPHMSLLGFGTEENIEWKCGGSLISDKFVLTAAHCLYTPSLGDVTFARLGDLNIKSTSDDAKSQQIKIIQRYFHPDYNSDESHYNDIGLIELEHPVSFTKYVRPACIQSKENSNSNFIATGWGNTEFGGTASDVLQKVDLVMYSYDKCNITFGPQRKLERGVDVNSQLCAGGGEGEQKDTCQGDSGGPLQVEINDSPKLYEIIGVTSFGKGCGLENIPGVYTKVDYFNPWIVDIVWK